MRRFGLIALAIFALSTWSAGADPAVNIQCIANEGFLIEIGTKKILIDALFDDPTITYCHIPDQTTLTKMETSHPPFDLVDLILVTHAHRDHFSAGPIARRIENDTTSVLVGPPQMVEALRPALPEDFPVHDRIVTVNPDLFASTDLEIAGIKVRAMRLHHSRYMVTDPETGKEHNRHADVENIVYLIEIDGIKLIHVGDAVLPQNPELFDGERFPRQKIDFAFLEYFDWSPETKEILERWMTPDHIIFMHLPPEIAKIEQIRRRLEADFPNAFIFDEPLELKNF